MMRRLAALALFALPLSVLGQISSSSPSSIPAGLTTASLKLSGNFPDPSVFTGAGYGVCVFNGTTGTYTSITPDAENDTQIALTVPAANLNLNPSLFSSDQYNLVLFVSGPSGSCSAADTSFSIQVIYPAIASTNLFAFPAPAGATSPTTPNRVEITGTNFLQTGFNGAVSNTFVQLSPATPSTANLKFVANDGVSVTATLPLPTQITPGQVELDIVPCNSNGTYNYCSTVSPGGANYFQLSTSQVDTTPTPTAVLTGAATSLKVNLTATGSDVSTDGGTYRVPAPGGTVTFSDGATVVGTAPAVVTRLGLSAISLTSIHGDLSGANFNSFKRFSVDLNNDGAPDVVLYDPAGRSLNVLLGTAPTGNLLDDQSVDLAFCTSVPSLAFGDLNKDGYLDLVFACVDPNNTTTINYMLNNGDGTFAPAVTLPNVHGEQVAIGDVNHDGIPDIFVSGLTTDAAAPAVYGIQTYINDGTPNFTLGSLTTTTDSAGTQIQLVAQDLNNDGFADIGLLHYDNNAGATVVALYQNTQSNSFTSVNTVTVCSCTVTNGSLSFLSITGSKTFPDMAVVLSDNDLILIDAVNNKSSSLGFSSFNTTDYSPATSLVIGDYTGDGLADVATYDGSDVTVHAGDGNGLFPNASTPLQQANNLVLVSAQDLNGDGLADLVALETSSGVSAYTFIADGKTSATLPYAFLTAGTHHITAAYSGSPALYGSSGSIDVLVSAPPVADVNIIVPPAVTGSTSATQTYAAGGTLSMNFKVVQDAGDSRPSTSPTGTVTIVENGSPVGTATLSPSATNVGTSTASLSNFESATTGTHNFTVTYSGDPNFSGSTQTFPYTVVQQTPTVTWATPASIPFGTALSSTQLNAVAKDAAGTVIPGSFTYSFPATTVLPVGNTQLSVDFTPTDTTDFTSTGGQGVTVTQVVTADTTTTSLTVPSAANYGDQVTLTATVTTQLSSTINGSVTFTANGTTVGQGQLTGNVATATASTQNPAFVIGSNTIVATLTGTTNYVTSSDTKTITLSKGTPVISWPPPANVATGTALSSIQLNAVAQDASANTLSGTYVYNPAAGTTLNQGTTPLSVTFTPSAAISGHYNTATGSNSITALPPSTVSVGANPNPAVVQTAVSLTATVSSTGGIPTGTITFFDNTTQTQIGTATLVPGSSSSTATIAYTPTSTGTHSINALYSGSGTIFSGNGSTNLNVTVPPPTITWNPAVTSIAYGTALTASELNATTTVPGTFTYSPNFGAILPVNPQTILGVTFVPTDTSIPPASSSTLIAVTQFTPLITWATPASIAYGTPLSSTQLNAVAKDASGNTIPGAFTYSPTAGTVLTVGTTQLSLSFIPTDTTNYASTGGQNVHVNQVVTLAPTTTAFTINPTTANYGDTLTLNATVTGTPTGTINGGIVFTETRTQQTVGTAQVINGVASTTVSTANPLFQIGSNAIVGVFQQTGQYATSTSTAQSFTLGQASPVITYNPTPTSITYGTALVASQLNATSSAAGSFTYSQAVGDILAVGSHTINATFTPTDTTHYRNVITPAVITVSQFTPVLSWTPSVTSFNAGTPLDSTMLNATAKDGSGNTIPGAFTYNSPVGTLLAQGGHDVGAQFVPTDTVNYATTTASRTFNVNKAASATAVAASPNPAPAPNGQTVTLTATITLVGTPFAGLPAATGTVTFLDGQTQAGSASINASGVASVTLTNPTSGNHTIQANYAGDGNYQASSNTTTLVVQQPIPIITWVPGPLTYGTPLGAGQLNATATFNSTTVPGTFSYSPAAGANLTAGPQTLNVTFTPTNPSSFQSATKQVTLNVSQFVPTIVWPTPSAVSTGTALSSTQLNASASGVGGIANLPGTFTYTPPSGTILSSTGSQPLSVLFTPTDANYATATGTNHISVVLPPTTTTLTSSVNPTQFGQPTVLTATIRHTTASTSPITGTVSFFANGTLLGQPATVTLDAQTGVYAANLTVSNLTAGSHALNATYSGDANNDTSDSTGTSQGAFLQIVQTAQVTLLWTPAPATIPYGTPLSAAQLDAVAISPYVASVPANITYNQPLGTILTAGVQTLTATVTPVDTADFTAGAGSAQITVTQATPTITWATPAAITQGTPLSATQLNATAAGIDRQALPGTFTYNPVLGTILPSGPNTLSVTFTPTDAVNYAVNTAQVILNVSIPPAKVTVTSPTNPSQYGQMATLTATVVAGGTLTAIPTGSVAFFDSGKPLGTATLNAAGIATLPVAILATGGHQITANYLGDAANAIASSTAITQTITQAPSVVTFAPNPATITYGTTLSAAQLDATATSAYIATVPGTFVYTPALGSTPGAGTTTLSVTFTPTDTTNFSTVTKTATLTVSRATPTLTFPNPADTVVGTKLSSTQLNATATGVGGATLPGVFTYTPATGALVTAGAQTLSVSFTPTDITDYTTATTTATLNGVPVTLTALSPNTATLGDPAKTVTVTGTGFAPDAVVRVNGVPVATTYVSSTSLTAVIPATSFAAVATLQITVNDPTQAQTTTALPITVTAPPVTIKVTAPGTVTPTSQPVISFTLTNPYPVSVTGTFTLTFQSGAADGASDPNIVFGQSGTRTLSFTIPAGQTSTTSSTAIQAGTIAGNIVVTLTLQAGGIDVTPPGTAPVTINIPAVVPGITSVDPVVRNGKNLTVTVNGYSNTHQATQAKFHFVPVSGKTILTPDITVDITSLFNTWYASTGSTAFGSAFGYDQPFTLDDDASIIASVTVTITNSVGVSASGSTQ